MEQAVVLAGGRGTRLGELTAETPKPLLPVAGEAFLTWLVGNLENQGVRDLILSIGYQARKFEAWEDDSDLQVNLRSYVEDEPLGTGGALPLIGDWLDEAFFVLNGDTLFDVELRAMEARLATSEALGVVAMREVPDAGRYGTVRLEGDRVVSFHEKQSAGRGLINGGVYAFRKRVLDRIRSPSSLEADLLPELAESGELLGYVSDGFFIDIGLPETYDEAQSAIPAWWWRRTGGRP